MKSRLIISALLAASFLVPVQASAWWIFSSDDKPKIYGNIDHRQVSLAFKDSERISKVNVQEGDAVKEGQVLAELETTRLKEQIAAQEAALKAQEALLLKLRNGNRPEEIAQSRAQKEAAAASLLLAQREYNRTKDIYNSTQGRALSKSNMDQAESELKVAVANLDVADKALRLMEIGTRYEEIAQQEAQVAQTKAQLDLLKTELKDSQLLAPSDAVIRRRLLEPGDMASPSKAVFSLAVQDPIWARAYVSEKQLGEFKVGQKVDVYTDSLPGKAIPATIGFVSSVAEFTPKSIETEDLRTSLVYEVRAYIDNPPPELKLGMPVTVVPISE